MREIVFLISVVGIACASWAQTSHASWADLSAVQPGQKIQIVDMNSKKRSGAFVNVSDNAISYRDTAGERTMQKPDVRSVKLMVNKHRLRDAVIGGAVGGGAGALGQRHSIHARLQSFCVFNQSVEAEEPGSARLSVSWAGRW
jgi:hypothetical protein